MNETIILTRKEVASLITHNECIEAVEQAFAAHAEGRAGAPGVLGIHTDEGAFHIKAGCMRLDRNYFVAKSNGNFPQNPSTLSLPTIQGVIVVCDADNGTVLCVMDSIEISILRTGAATAVAAKYLSKKDSSVATIWGCGNQGRISAKMISTVRSLKTIYLYDTNPLSAQSVAVELKKELNADIVVVNDPLRAVSNSDICVTCTPSKEALIYKKDLTPGLFVAAIGTDNEHKQEIHPDVLKSSKVVADLTDQAATIGDLQHAIASGVMKKSDVYAELGEIVTGKKPGRTSDKEVIIFDSTGMALQDVAAASIAYRKATEQGLGDRVNFGA